jgi:hypothetical protein
VLGADLVFGLAMTPLLLMFGLVGGIQGAKKAAAKSLPQPEIDAQAKKYALWGSVLGAGLSLYPAMLAQRSVLRNKNCTNPALGSVASYNTVKYIGLAALGVAGKAVAAGSPMGGSLAQLAGAFIAPLAGQAIVKK